MKVKRFQISPELLFEILSEGFHPAGYSVIENAVPKDARLVNVHHAWTNFIELLIESDSFPETFEGEVPILLSPVVRKERSDPRCLCVVGCSVNGECPLHGDKSVHAPAL